MLIKLFVLISFLNTKQGGGNMVFLDLRPSRAYTVRYIYKELKKRKNKIVVDASSAYFKYKKVFGKNEYIGMDIDIELLVQGINNNKEGIGFYGDISDLSLPEGSIDICVSTNTLYSLPINKRLKAISNLSKITREMFILHIQNDDDFDTCIDVLKSNFSNVELLFIKNKVSEKYEDFVYEKVNIDYRSKPVQALFIIPAMFLSVFEGSKSGGGVQCLVKCTNKYDRTSNELVFDELDKISTRLYKVSAHM